MPGHLPKATAADSWWRLFLLFLLGTFWGLQFTLLKIADGSSLSELGILTLCMLLLSAAYLAALSARRAWFRPTLAQARFFSVSAFFGYVVPFGAVILVAERLAAGLIVLYTEALIPVCTVAITLLLRTEAMSRRRLLAVATALLGIGIALRPELTGGGTVGWVGLLLLLAIPLSYAIDGIYVAARWPRGLRPFQVVTGEAVAGALMLLPLWLLLEGWPALPDRIGAGEWAILAFVLISFLEVYIYFHLLRTAGAVFVAFGSFVSLFSGFFWGGILLGEAPRSSVWLAVGLVCLALYMIHQDARSHAADGCAPETPPAD